MQGSIEQCVIWSVAAVITTVKLCLHLGGFLSLSIKAATFLNSSATKHVAKTSQMNVLCSLRDAYSNTASPPAVKNVYGVIILLIFKEHQLVRLLRRSSYNLLLAHDQPTIGFGQVMIFSYGVVSIVL